LSSRRTRILKYLQNMCIRAGVFYENVIACDDEGESSAEVEVVG
jgi:hypothetical protein